MGRGCRRRRFGRGSDCRGWARFGAGMKELLDDVRRVLASIDVAVVTEKPRGGGAAVVEVNVGKSEVTLHLGPVNEVNSRTGAEANVTLDRLFWSAPYRTLDREVTMTGVRYRVARV